MQKKSKKKTALRPLATPAEVERAFDRLYPLHRSILGPGYRESLKILSEYIPFITESYRTGERALGWVVPREWRLKEAYLEDPSGRRIIDAQNSTLSILNYSAPVDARLTLQELKPHLYSLPNLPDAVPYTTSYYQERWGFCLADKQKQKLPDGVYHAVVDSAFVDGELVIGQAVLPGKSTREILLSSYLCHPSLANNELSGPLVLAMLYQRIAQWENRYYTYRFVINPETIGSLAYLERHGTELRENLLAGLVLTCLGGARKKLRLKRSRKDSKFKSRRAYVHGLRSGKTRRLLAMCLIYI